MGARGPKTGSGEISGWIVDQLMWSRKGLSAHEIRMGSGFTVQQIQFALWRMRNGTDPSIELVPSNGARGPLNRPCMLYRLKKEVQVAKQRVYRARTRPGNPIRALDNAFFRIVSERAASA